MIKRAPARNWFGCVAAASSTVVAWVAPAVAQPYASSVVGTEFDFITESDPSLFERLEYVGKQEREMADKRPNTPELMKQAFVLDAHFSDRTRVVIVVDAAFGSPEAARTEAMRYVHPLGKLPTAIRKGIDRGLIVHKGGEDTTAFSDQGLIFVYSDNATKRIGTHDLEETIFHESIHASWDGRHARSQEWTDAQTKDGGFITRYAEKKPQGEDLAESALFAYTLLHHPERIPAEDAKRIRELIPNRIAYIAKLLPPGEPIFTTIDPPPQPEAVAEKPEQPQGKPQAVRDHTCSIDLNLPGMMKDIVSNALMRGLSHPEEGVQTFLVDAEKKYKSGPEVLRAAAAHFKIEEAVLAAEVEKFKHCNCGLDVAFDGDPNPRVEGAPRDDAAEVSAFAKDVTLHVVLHEIGHALIREFDIPVLGNEETTADAFATYYLTTHLPERAVDVLKARTTSLMIEARESPAAHWNGEHDHDGRRAFQIAALAIAADAEKYAPVAAVVGMSQDDIRKARDYGGEIRRSWRRVLAPLWMPEGAASSEARVVCDSSTFIDRLCSNGLASEIESAAKHFDWHSQVTIRFADGDGRAGWSRSARTVTVHSAYVRRFIDQGARGLPGTP